MLQQTVLSAVPTRVVPKATSPSRGRTIADGAKPNPSPWQLSDHVKPLCSQASYPSIGAAGANIAPPVSEQEPSMNGNYSAISTINELRDKLMSMGEPR